MRLTYLLPLLLVLSCAPVRDTSKMSVDTEPPWVAAADYRRYIENQSLRRSFEEAFGSILHRPEFFHTLPSIIVMSADSSDTLFTHFPDLLLRPASNQKLITSAAALHLLGPAYNFRTVLYRKGMIREGVLEGDLVIKGSGDPLLTLAHLESMADVLLDFGIRSVSGSVIVDDSFFDDEFWPTGWMWDDEPFSFAPFISPLSVNKNTIDIIVERNPIGENSFQIRTDPATAFVTFDTTYTILEDNEISNIDIIPDRIRSSNHFTVKGDPRTVVSRRNFTVTLRDPALFTGMLFSEILRDRNIVRNIGATRGITSGDAVPLIQLNTPLGEVLRTMNKISDNLSAELTWKTIAAEVSGEPGTGSKTSRLIEDLYDSLELSHTHLRMVDGSGVSYYNLTTVRHLAELLSVMYRDDKFRRPFYESLPVLGIDGTLMNRGYNTDASRRVRAKTGTLSGVSSLSGYVETISGETLIFSILFQNFTAAPGRYRRLQDQICDVLVHFDRRAILNKLSD